MSRETSAQAVVEAGAEEPGSQPGQEHKSLRDFTRIFSLSPSCVQWKQFPPKQTNKQNQYGGGGEKFRGTVYED